MIHRLGSAATRLPLHQRFRRPRHRRLALRHRLTLLAPHQALRRAALAVERGKRACSQSKRLARHLCLSRRSTLFPDARALATSCLTHTPTSASLQAVVLQFSFRLHRRRLLLCRRSFLEICHRHQQIRALLHKSCRTKIIATTSCFRSKYAGSTTEFTAQNAVVFVREASPTRPTATWFPSRSWSTPQSRTSTSTSSNRKWQIHWRFQQHKYE